MASSPGSTFALNTSTSKQNFSFGKDKRFSALHSPRTYNTKSCYDVKDHFDKPSESGRGKAFGSINRFGYYHTPTR